MKCERCGARLYREVECHACPICGARVYDYGASASTCWTQYRCDAQACALQSMLEAQLNSGSKQGKAMLDVSVHVSATRQVVSSGNALIETIKPSKAWKLQHFAKTISDKRERQEVAAHTR